MKTKSKASKQTNVKKITTVAMLTAVAAVLQFIEVSIPIMPDFIKLDFSDLPEIIGAFACGPLAGVLIALLKNILHILFGSSGAIGELSNFILGASYALTAGLIYKKMPNLKGAVIGGLAASAIMAAVSFPSNFYIIYPLYYSVMKLPMEAILDMYQVLRPSTESIAEALLVFNVPFTFLKGLVCAVFAVIISRPLHRFIVNTEN